MEYNELLSWLNKLSCLLNAEDWDTLTKLVQATTESNDIQRIVSTLRVCHLWRNNIPCYDEVLDYHLQTTDKPEVFVGLKIK